MADKIQASYVEGVVKTITAGSNVTVDNTDPENPVISASLASGDTLPNASANNQYVGWNGSAYVARQIQYSEIANTPPEVTDFVSKANGGVFDGQVSFTNSLRFQNGSGNLRGLLDLNVDSGRFRLYSDTGTALVRIQADGDSYISGNLGIGQTVPAYALDVAGTVNASTLQTGGLLMFANSVRSQENTDLEIRASSSQQVKLRVAVGESINIMADRYAQFMRRSGLTLEGIAGFDSLGRIGELTVGTGLDIQSGALVATGGATGTDTLDDVAQRNGTTSAPITVNNTLTASGQVTFSNLSDGIVMASDGVLGNWALGNLLEISGSDLQVKGSRTANKIQKTNSNNDGLEDSIISDDGTVATFGSTTNGLRINNIGVVDIFHSGETVATFTSQTGDQPNFQITCDELRTTNFIRTGNPTGLSSVAFKVGRTAAGNLLIETSDGTTYQITPDP